MLLVDVKLKDKDKKCSLLIPHTNIIHMKSNSSRKFIKPDFIYLKLQKRMIK